MFLSIKINGRLNSYYRKFRIRVQKTLNKLCHFKQIDNYGLEEHIIPERVYFNELATNILSKKKKKKNNKTPLPKEIRCIGRKIDFSQCSRRKKGNSDFCEVIKKIYPAR